MKYKVGDKVRVVANITSNSRKDNYIGKTYTILNKYDNYPAGQAYGIGEDYVVYGEELELILKHQSIHIYTDGKTTTAKLCEGKTVVKTATAKRHPDDEFDFLEGARWAFGRLVNGDEVYRLTQEVKHLQAEIEKLKAELSVNLNDLEWMTEQRDKLQAEVVRLKAEQMKTSVFDWDAFKQGKIAVHCDTEEKAKAFLKECHDRGLTWCAGESLLSKSNWDVYRGETCYTSEVTFSPKSHFEEEGYTIIPCPFTPEPAYYNGKVVCIATNSGVYHTVGKIYECKDGFLDSDTGKGRHNFIPYKSFEDLQLRTLPEFIELVED